MADKLDLSKLLASAKKKSDEAPPRETAPPSDTVVVAGLDISKLVAKPEVSAKPAAAKNTARPGLQAPKIKPEPAPKPLPAKMPSNPKLEKQVSRQGMRIDRLNVEQKEARKYPHGCFGVDEISVALMESINIMRSNIYRATAEYPRFVVGAQIVGAVRRDAYLEWDGANLSPMLEHAPSEPTAHGVLDADAVIDNIRGKLSCALYNIGAYAQVHGDGHLAHLLHVGAPHLTDEQRDFIREREEAALYVRQRERHACKTPLDWLQRNIELRIASPVRFMDDPLFFRVTVSGMPKQELLFHIEKRKLTVLAGKPGETLMPGALEVEVSPQALAALWDMECGWPFLFTAGLARASGSLELLSELHWVNREIVRRIGIFNATKSLPGQGDDYWLQLRTSAPARK